MISNIATIDHLKLYYETFGSSDNEPVLLLMGTGLPGLFWSDDFCNKLAGHNFYVIRYDHRDTGSSSYINYDEYPYTSNDLAEDALKLLDQLSITKSHMIGLSMGGHLVQLIAIHHPERLLSSTLIMSTANQMVFFNALAGKDTPDSCLPKPNQQVLDFLLSPRPDLNNREKNINYSLTTWKLFNGIKASFDENYWKALITMQYDRTQNPNAQANHRKACLASPVDRTPLLKKVNIPTLIIHGSDDPVLPLEHGKSLAEAIKNSRLLIINNMGHALNPLFQDKIISAIATHLKQQE